ncbi:hypothetical protein GCM10009627_09720 [Curtobacterium herbarum]|uniref:Uncharacterized protein n=1 Tax=Curtobacterium herbarum TaxID=150122 RepID=A0ABP4K1I4_9MICO
MIVPSMSHSTASGSTLVGWAGAGGCSVTGDESTGGTVRGAPAPQACPSSGQDTPLTPADRSRTVGLEARTRQDVTGRRRRAGASEARRRQPRGGRRVDGGTIVDA